MLAAGALLGAVLTLLSGSEPGILLSFFIITASLAATLGVRSGAVHVLFPLPTLAFFVTAVLTGAVHDSALASSTAGLGAAFLQWVAGIFIPATVATILVLIVGGVRWLLTLQFVSGQFTMSSRAGTPRSARPGRVPPRSTPASWLDADTPHPARGTQAARDARQPGGKPRPPTGDRDARPADPNKPRDRTTRQAPRNPGPQRQPRSRRDPWDQR